MAERGPAPARARTLVLLGSVLALLVIGGLNGLLIGRLHGGPGPGPSAGSTPVAVGFTQDLLVRLRQAAGMAAWARDHSADPEVRGLAGDIEAAAAPQVGRLEGWLELWGEPELPPDGPLRWIIDDPSDTHTHGPAPAAGPAPGTRTIPGLASDDDLRRLRDAGGRDLDVVFLQLMLRHHEMGEPVLDVGSQLAEVPQVRDVGVRVLAAEAADGTRLRALLAARDAAPSTG